MGKSIKRLTARTVETIKTPGRHADGDNLFLIVDPSGAKRWAFIYRRDGKLREMGLGGLARVSLADARALASDARQLLGQGKDPLLERRAVEEQRKAAEAAERAARVTFGDAADAYIRAHEEGWRNDKHRQQWRMTLGAYAAPLRSKPVAEIDTADVLAVLQAHWNARPETASRLRNRIELVLDAARAAGHRHGENPARWRGHLDKLLPPRKKLTRGHHAALPYEEINAFICRLRALEGPAARLLEFIVLTASRYGEAAGARWSEIDFASSAWVIRADRMKAGRPHRVPLSKQALAILQHMAEYRIDDAIFPGARVGRPISSTGVSKIVAKLAGDCTTHGFRSAFRDWAGNETNFPREICEAALAHAVGDKSEQAYRRSDALEKRRQLMQAWANYCDQAAERKILQFAS